MKCSEKTCTVTLTAQNTFVRPLAAIAAEAKKTVADIDPRDLAASRPVCEDCASLHVMCGEVWHSWEGSLRKIAEERILRAALAKAAQGEADRKVREWNQRASARWGRAGLGSALLAAGLHPSPVRRAV